MGLGDLINDVGDGLEHLATGAEHVVGTIVDDGSHLIGDGLNTLGLHGAATAVDNFGDSVADHLGDGVAEKELGQTTDPTQLIHGDVAAIHQTSTRLSQFASAFGETAQGLAGIDTAHWQGSAADAFRQTYQQHPQGWSDAQSACSTAALAWQDYGHAVDQAQSQAKEAIALYQQGTQATAQAKARYAQAVTSYNQQAQTYNQVVASGGDPGPMPRPPAAFSDPGAADQQHAQEMLTAARQQRDAAGGHAQQAISGAIAHAPQTPSFSQRMLNDVSDLTMTAGVEGEHFLGGVFKGVGDLGKFARSLDPFDPYNVTHPAQFIDGMSSTAAGLVHAALHPQQLVQGLIGSGWGSDPAEALGRLVPNVVGVIGTDGGSEAASVGEAADAASTAGRVATDVAGQGTGDLANAAAGTADRQAATGAAEHAGAAASGPPVSAPHSVPGPSLNPGDVQRISGDLGTVESDLAKIHVHDPGTIPASATPATPVTHVAPPPEIPGASAAPVSPQAFSNLAGSPDAAAAEIPTVGNAGAGGMSSLQQRLAGLDEGTPTVVDPPPTSGGPLASDPQVRADLAQTAMQQPDLAVMDGLDDTVVWRRDNGTLYRSDSRGPAAFTEGFPPRDINGLDVRDHVNYNPPNTGYISTTTNPDYWQTWGSDAHYFYEIDAPGGVDTNATLGLHQYIHENEIAMPGGIRPERVKGLWPVLHDPVTHDPSLGEYVPNPNYQPLESIGQ